MQVYTFDTNVINNILTKCYRWNMSKYVSKFNKLNSYYSFNMLCKAALKKCMSITTKFIEEQLLTNENTYVVLHTGINQSHSIKNNDKKDEFMYKTFVDNIRFMENNVRYISNPSAKRYLHQFWNYFISNSHFDYRNVSYVATLISKQLQTKFKGKVFTVMTKDFIDKDINVILASHILASQGYFPTDFKHTVITSDKDFYCYMSKDPKNKFANFKIMGFSISPDLKISIPEFTTEYVPDMFKDVGFDKLELEERLKLIFKYKNDYIQVDASEEDKEREYMRLLSNLQELNPEIEMQLLDDDNFKLAPFQMLQNKLIRCFNVDHSAEAKVFMKDHPQIKIKENELTLSFDDIHGKLDTFIPNLMKSTAIYKVKSDELSKVLTDILHSWIEYSKTL